MKFIKRICCIVFCLLILSCITFSAGAAENQKIVKIGSPEVDNFLTLDKHGNENGFLADYLKTVSAKTGWKFEFVRCSSFQYREMLKNGTIDMYAPVTKDIESEKDYCFSSEKCCISYIALVTSKDNYRLYYEDWANYGELSVGMVKNGTINSAFEKYAKKQGLKYKKVYFDDVTQMRNAVINRQTDCAVLSNLDITSNIKTISRINFKPAFFIANKDNQKLIDDFSSAVYSILLEDPSFIANLFSQHYGKAEKASQCFTREEAAFVQQSSPIKVVVDINNVPFQSYNSLSHNFEG